MKRWYKYIKPYKKYFIFGPICMIVEVLGEIFLPQVFSLVIKDRVEGTLTPALSLMYMGMMVLLALIMMAGGLGGAYFGAKASVNFASDLRFDVYKRVQSFSFRNIDRFSTGSLITRLTNDVTQMQNFVNSLLRMALRSPGLLIGALIMAIIMQPKLSLVLAVIIPLMLLSVGGLIVVGFGRFKKMQKKIDTLNSTVQEGVTNIRVVKSFVREEYEEKKFKTANGDLKKTATSAAMTMIFISPILTFFMNVTTLLVIWFGGRLVLDNGMEINKLTTFITYVSQILMSLLMVTFLLMMSSRSMASANRIKEVLDEKLDLDDKNAAYPELTVERGEIEFKDVSFKYYADSQEKALDGIDLKIPAGTTVGIIGSTGCGKSTLVSMIPRLYDVDSGSVFVDGVNVKDYSLFNIREGIGMVLQKNTLFSGTIEENLRWGDENATDEDIVKAATYAQADKFIKSFSGGYDYSVDQGGVNVSGGQKQRLCIARALLKKPKILILDDSTSAVDTATEAQIRRAFANELKGSTKIIIAQRISSVKDADMIVVMNEGKITGIGTHEELLQSNTEYKEIYASQTDKSEERGE